MDVFTQNKLLIRLIIVLIILNVASIGFHLMNGRTSGPPEHPDNGKKKDLSEILRRELHLSPEQADAIKALRNDFFEQEKELEKKIREERDSMNTAMFSKTIDDSLVISLAGRISQNELKMELLRYEQAKKFKAICTPEQVDKFNQLVLEIRDYFKPEKEPRKK